MKFVVGLLFSSVGIGLLIAVPLVVGVVLLRHRSWVQWLGVALLVWSLLLIGMMIYSVVYSLLT